jgi:hypothetical protein
MLSLNQAPRAGRARQVVHQCSVKRTARKQSPLKIDEQALLGVSGECGEQRQAVLNYSNSTLFAEPAASPHTPGACPTEASCGCGGEQWTNTGFFVD